LKERRRLAPLITFVFVCFCSHRLGSLTKLLMVAAVA
jgi:hypothetical protein